MNAENVALDGDYGEERIEDVAAEYRVSSWGVWSQLVNCGRIGRESVPWLERWQEHGEEGG